MREIGKRLVMEMASQPKSEHVMKIIEDATLIIEISGVFIVLGGLDSILIYSRSFINCSLALLALSSDNSFLST